MVASLPERTVDAWVSISIADRFPNALIWAPTNRGADNWDFAVATPAAPGRERGKLVILENKGTEPLKKNNDHRIRIDWRQLNTYCTTPSLKEHVFYVLPSPPWSGAPAGKVPIEATKRNSATSWLHVIPALDLLAWLRAKGKKSLRATHLNGLGAVPLKTFLDEIDRCERGQTWAQPLTAISDSWKEDFPSGGKKRARSASLSPMAMFIPEKGLAGAGGGGK